MLNFMKGSLFSRRTAEPEQAGREDKAQVLAVWGSPGSGKTTVSVKLAQNVASRKRNVLLLLCDMTAPMLPYICPPSDLEGDHSLCSVLAAAHISDTLVKQNCVTHKRIHYLSLLGMRKGENVFTYPPYTPELAAELIHRLREIAPFIIIDCGSGIAHDILSAVSLLEADAVLRLVNCDLKSVSYLSSQLPLLREQRWDADKQYKTASNVKPQQASAAVEQVIGQTAFQLPYSAELEQQALAGDLLRELALKDSRGFRREIERIAREVFAL